MIRSFLFVPADSERKLANAADCAADALILDLEDSVVPAARPAARELAGEYLATSENAWVRINPMDTADAMLDLQAVLPAKPAGIVLPKPRSADDAIVLGRHLDALEDRHGIPVGQTRILPLCTERPAALFSLDGYIGATPRLAGLSWGAEDLGAAVGAMTNRVEDGSWLPPYELARSLCLFAAAAAEVPAIDTVFTDFRNQQGLREFAARARRDGFSGMLAIHPDQVGIINAAFVPTPEEVERAERIVELFAASPGTGALSLDGAMVDRPHLRQAEQLLDLARRLGATQTTSKDEA